MRSPEIELAEAEAEMESTFRLLVAATQAAILAKQVERKANLIWLSAVARAHAAEADVQRANCKGA